MYNLDVKPEADDIFKKLSKKNHQQLTNIHKKILQIRKNPYHKYKFLKKPLQMFNRVHIDKHFVLLFKINHEERVVDVYYFNHHDKIYQWRPKSEI